MAHKPIDPDYYKSLNPEPVIVIEGWKLPYHLATAIAYISRCELKGSKQADLIKAANHIFREATGRWLPQEVLNERVERDNQVLAEPSGHVTSQSGGISKAVHRRRRNHKAV